MCRRIGNKCCRSFYLAGGAVVDFLKSKQSCGKVFRSFLKHSLGKPGCEVLLDDKFLANCF